MTVLFFVVLAGCSKETKEIKETDVNSALMYTFKIDEHEYRFRMLDGWLKYPVEDKSIAFLVGNKENKAFMSAGVEPVETSLEAYQEAFVEKLNQASVTIQTKPELKKINGMDSYYLSYIANDKNNRPLTYKVYLIETEGYFVNLAAWTSQEEPTEKVLDNMETMLNAFEQLK